MSSLYRVVRLQTAVLCLSALAWAAEITGSVKDPSGAAVPTVIVTIVSASGQTFTAKSDRAGTFKFTVPDGAYTLAIRHTGFAEYRQEIAAAGKMAALSIELKIAEVRELQEVTGRSGLANADPIYRASRASTLQDTVAVENLVLKRDVGVLTLKRGTVSLGTPVSGKVTIAVFVGEGVLSLKPAILPEARFIQSITGSETVEEPFDRALFVFTDDTAAEIRKASRGSATEPRAQDALSDLRRGIRQRTENARSMIEHILEGESMANADADIAADLYNPKQPGFFSAHIDGRKHGDLRFHVKPRGVFPEYSPEEVALVHLSPGSAEEGIWYSAHFAAEYENSGPLSLEDKRVAAAEHYRIETVIGNNDRLTSTAEIRLRCVNDGDRLVKFGLLPNLRVSRVSMGGQDIPFIQQSRKEDGSFYVVMPVPMKAGTTYTIVAEYGGDKVVDKAGGGSFAVGARTSWYPSLNSFHDRSTFDLTFKYPKRYKFVGVGKLVKETKEGDFGVSQWVSEVPLAVAGFNFGEFKEKRVEDPKTKYIVEGYATTELPDYLHAARDIGGMTAPSRLLDNGMSQAQASIQLFEHFFGKAPYGRIAITQQPQMNFGQSWPTLVYLPLIAFFDGTQRFQLLGGINPDVNEFVDEVTAHEVAHQWWGHMVGWASYRDQWLSEGLASFSAGLFLQATEAKPDKYLKYWEHATENVLQKYKWGLSSNDAGPIWLGWRASTFKNPRGYQGLAYDKGSYVVHMLRQMMWHRETGDERFRKMMHDFVSAHLHKNASTESFLSVVERHMTPEMDLERNKTMNWFFRQWVYGSEIPRYKLEYTVGPAEGEKVLLTAKLTQSDVSQGFMMPVPIYADFDSGRPVRLGAATMRGSTSLDFKIVLPKKPKAVLVNAFYDVLARN